MTRFMAKSGDVLPKSLFVLLAQHVSKLLRIILIPLP